MISFYKILNQIIFILFEEGLIFRVWDSIGLVSYYFPENKIDIR